MKRENLEKLKTLQEQLELKQTYIKSRKEEFGKLLKNDTDYVDNLKSQIELYKQGIEVEALAEFKETGKKSLLGGVKIQVKKLIKYDLTKALAYCKEKDMFLTFDKKAFEKVAAGLGLVFVKTETVEKVTFPKEIKLEEIK